MFRRFFLLFTELVFFVLPCFLHAQTLRINEIMAHNTLTIMDEDAEYSDWIEIYNAGTETIQLSGWSFGSGVYFCRLETEHGVTSIRKLVFIK